MLNIKNIEINDKLTQMVRMENFINKEFGKDFLGTLKEDLSHDEIIILKYTWKNHKYDIKIIFNTEVDFLRIMWDEDYWRDYKYYKGEW